MGKIYLQEKITPVADKYVVADRNGFLTAGDLVTEAKPQLIITGININLSEAVGITLSCNSQSKILELNYVDSNTIICYPNEFGTWTVTVEMPGNEIVTGFVDVTAISIYYISLTSTSVSTGGLDDASWDTIKDKANEDTAGSYWSIGDVKEIPLDGNLGQGGNFGQLTFPSGYKLYAFIIGIDHNAGIEGSGITFQFGYRLETSQHAVAFIDGDYNNTSEQTYAFRMNGYLTRYNGWEDSFARNNLLSVTDTGSLYSALPSDLTSKMAKKHLYTDNSSSSTTSEISPTSVSRTDDYLFLLSEFEIFGNITNSNPYEKDMQKQYAYYKTYSRNKYKYNSGNINNPEPCCYWTRSKSYADGSDGLYCMVSERGTSTSKECYYSEGFAPAFFIGNSTPVNTNIRIVTPGAKVINKTSVMGSYIVVNGKAYSETGNILLTGGSSIEIWAKSGVSNESNSFVGNIGCEVNGVKRGEITKNTLQYSNIYTYQTRADFSGVVSIYLVGGTPTTYGNHVYYIKIIVDD